LRRELNSGKGGKEKVIKITIAIIQLIIPVKQHRKVS